MTGRPTEFSLQFNSLLSEGATNTNFRHPDDLARKSSHQQRLLELMIIVLTVGITALLYRIQVYRLVILNLYFLPVTLSGFFLGRYRAGVIAVLSVLGASIVASMHLSDAAGTPLLTAFAVAVWACVLGLTALLTGTLSDERTGQLEELHDAYVGVVEVLAQYLQGAHPRLKARSIRVAELSHNVAARLKFSPREIDDIRVAALLYDVGNIEITSRVIRRAIDTLDSDTGKQEPQTIQGMDLMLSLASVLNGAVPLLLNQQDGHDASQDDLSNAPLGARIISAVREFDALTEGTTGGQRLQPAAAIQELRNRSPGYDPAILSALERLVAQSDRAPAPLTTVPSNGELAEMAVN
jgi:HD-GYP domain-containing protein (c-di-GMP phosphodiesterase class II)